VQIPGPGGIGLGACFDDVYEMNPRMFERLPVRRSLVSFPFTVALQNLGEPSDTNAEQSSQWDGFRHYSQPLHTNEPSTSKDRVYYGGTTKEEIMDSSNHRIGIQHWASEGIAGKRPHLGFLAVLNFPFPNETSPLNIALLQGRGILLDYHRWASSQSPSIKYSCFSTHAVSFESILAMCRAEDVTPRKGDILFIRTGMMPEWETFTEQQKKEYAAQEEAEHAGVEASIELLEWLWDSGITAVAGDAISWEVSRHRLAIFALGIGSSGWLIS
jgi:hypothetical protein